VLDAGLIKALTVADEDIEIGARPIYEYDLICCDSFRPIFINSFSTEDLNEC
jgi:hypothetical protein